MSGGRSNAGSGIGVSGRAASEGAGSSVQRRLQWRALALACVAFAASSPGQSFLISVFVDDFIAGTGLSRTTFSALYAAGTVVSAASMFLLGRLIDSRGLRLAWCVVTLMLALACGLASVAGGALMAFVALALLRTSGQGAFTLVGTLLVARSFRGRRGQAVAVANLALTLGSVALPPAVAMVIVATHWRTAYQMLGVALIVLVLPLAVLVRVPKPAGRDGGSAVGEAHLRSAVRLTRPGLPNLPSARAARLLGVLAAPPLIGTALTFHATSILGSRGVGYVEAGGVVGLMGAASAVGVILAGAVVDRLSTRAALVLLSGAMVAATLVIVVPARPAAYAAFTLLGLGMGATGVINGTVWARTFGTREIGRIQGMAQSSMITAAAVAPLVPALSLAVSGTHLLGLVSLCVLASGALLLASLSRD